jgi:hypothetical protein
MGPRGSQGANTIAAGGQLPYAVTSGGVKVATSSLGVHLSKQLASCSSPSFGSYTVVNPYSLLWRKH